MEDYIDNFRTSIESKLDEDTQALIADDIASLITSAENERKERENINNEIERLKKDKETLITANGNLLQQISFSTKEDKKDTPTTQEFSFSQAFDEKGNFIK